MPQRILAGAIGGIAGGILFGVLMSMMGMMQTIGSLVGSEEAPVGWVVHMVIATGIGVGYAVTFGAAEHSWGKGAGFGLAYGAIWWVLGPLLIMPAIMGMPLFQINQQALLSLVGHLIYGLVLGLVYTGVVQRAPERQRVA